MSDGYLLAIAIVIGVANGLLIAIIVRLGDILRELKGRKP